MHTNMVGSHLHLSSAALASSLKDQCENLVDVCMNVYQTIITELLPTPAKSHYTFNLRDLSKVFQGILMFDPAKLEVSTVC